MLLTLAIFSLRYKHLARTAAFGLQLRLRFWWSVF
jgi:hypothetical protein